MREHTNYGNRRKAEEGYRLIRKQAMQTLEPELQETLGLPVSLTDITVSALTQALTWGGRYAAANMECRQPGWDWDKVLRKFRRRPRRVELAIWVADDLCGLALGRISDRCVVATIHFIEGNPGGHPLRGRVLPVAVRFLEVLAASLEVKEVSIEQPVPELIEYYKRLGFIHPTTKGRKVLRLKKTLAS